MAAAVGLAALACAWAAAPVGAQAPAAPKTPASAEAPSVTIAILPFGTGAEEIGETPGMAPGAMSAGMATVSATQTFLDISAGNRIFTSLYELDAPPLPPFERQVPGWGRITERAESAPAEIVPGLLASTLRDAAIPARAADGLVAPALAAADRRGDVVRVPPRLCLESRCEGMTVVEADLNELPRLVTRLRGDDMLIAFERPPPPARSSLAIGIAGEGFDGNLTSDTTRTDGFVIATDIAPTILERFGLTVPDEMSGRAIFSEGDADAAGVAERAERMEVVAGRRGPVIVRNLIAWALLALAVALFSRGRLAPPAFALLGLSVVYLPLLLLAGAAARPSEEVERAIVGAGAPLLAALTLALLRGWSALALACGVTVGAYAIDMVAGSPLTAQSLLGPNPGLGVRFFGIGNELESTFAVAIPVGVGAALTAVAASGRAVSPRTALAAFLAAGVFFAALFAAGRFGADVGAAIVYPAGAAFAALAIPGAIRNRRVVALLLAAPVGGLALLAAIDLVLGGDAHLSRSVFDAGGASELADVAERRLRLSASSFERATGQNLFWFAVIAIAVAVWQRRRIAAWLAPVPLSRAGFAGAAGSVLLGVVANDSGATFLTIGTIGLLGCIAFAASRRAGTLP